MSSMQQRINHHLILKLSQCRKVSIENPFLRGIFNQAGHAFKGLPVHPITGDKCNYSLSRVYLTYLIQRLFNIHRIPGFEEKVSFPADNQLYLLLEGLNESDIQSHLIELSRLYEHTQSEMNTAITGKTIRVYRGFKDGVCEMLALAVAQARQRGETTARIYGNIFNFYAACDKGSIYSENFLEVCISHEIPIQDVLLCRQTVNGFNSDDQDIIVINRSPTGIFELPLTDITVRAHHPDAVEALNRITDPGSSFDHTFAFKPLYRYANEQPAPQQRLPDFDNEPGLFERLGRSIDRWKK